MQSRYSEKMGQTEPSKGIARVGRKSGPIADGQRPNQAASFSSRFELIRNSAPVNANRSQGSYVGAIG
jgi:hypothetical protein